MSVVVALGDHNVKTDEAVYLTVGRNIWNGDGISFQGAPELHFPPLLPFILGGLWQVLPSGLAASVLLTFISNVAILVLLAALAFRLGGESARLFTVWLAALTPVVFLVALDEGSGSEGPFTALLLAAVYVGTGSWSRVPPGVVRFAAGILLGAAYLIRPEALPLVAVFAAVYLAASLHVSVRSALLAPVPLLAGAAMFVVPYAAFLHSHTGNWEVTAKAAERSIETWRLVAEGDRRARSAILFEVEETRGAPRESETSLFTLAREHPAQYARIVGINAGKLSRALLVPRDTTLPSWRLMSPLLLVAAAWGAWCVRKRTAAVAALAVVVLGLVTVLSFFYLDRYFIPAGVALVLFAGVGLAHVRGRWRAPVTAAVLLVSALSAVPNFVDTKGVRLPADRESPHMRAAGRWVDRNAPTARVMTTVGNLPYYAPDATFVATPNADWEQMWRYARQRRVEYVLVHPRVRYLRPKLDAGGSTDPLDHGFREVFRYEKWNSTTVIYEVVARSG